MSKKVGVLVVHGMGSQADLDQTVDRDTSKPTFSKEMNKRVSKQLGAQFDAVAWREVLWAGVLQERQETYLAAIKRRTDFDTLRGFVVRNLSDAASYRKSPTDQSDSTYERVHAEVDRTLRDLRADLGDTAPILVLAHSLGGHIVSNFIYDAQKHRRVTGVGRIGTPIQDMETVAGLITFGCNIPIFLFAYAEDDIHPIEYPGGALPSTLRFPKWWYNFYDRDDVLAYPLRDIGPKYRALVAKKQLNDVPVDAGTILSSWNPASHNAYWKDPDVYEPVARYIKNMLVNVDRA